MDTTPEQRVRDLWVGALTDHGSAIAENIAANRETYLCQRAALHDIQDDTFLATFPDRAAYVELVGRRVRKAEEDIAQDDAQQDLVLHLLQAIMAWKRVGEG